MLSRGEAEHLSLHDLLFLSGKEVELKENKRSLTRSW